MQARLSEDASSHIRHGMNLEFVKLKAFDMRSHWISRIGMQRGEFKPCTGVSLVILD